MKLLTLEILQGMMENNNIQKDKETLILVNECINEIIELSRRYELINETLDDRLIELENLQSRSCENCKNYINYHKVCREDVAFYKQKQLPKTFGCNKWKENK